MTREERQKQLDEERIKNFNPNQLDGNPRKFYLRFVWCESCIHYHGDERCSCEAYPKGIPDKFSLYISSQDMNKHTSIEPDQVGEFIFSPKG